MFIHVDEMKIETKIVFLSVKGAFKNQKVEANGEID